MRRATTCLLVVAAFHIAAVAQAPVARGLSAAWSLDGRWSGVVGDEESGAIYTLRLTASRRFTQCISRHHEVIGRSKVICSEHIE